MFGGGSAPTRGAVSDSTRDDPLWYSLFTPKSKTKPAVFGGGSGPRTFDERTAPVPGGYAVKPEPKPLPEPQEEARPRIRPWQYVELILSNRRVVQGLAATVAFVLVSSMDVPWRDWLERQLEQVKAPLVAAMNAVSRPIQERAAFFIVDDFSQGVANWSFDSESVAVNSSGWLAVNEGLALHKDTMKLESYRLDFDAKIISNAMGWAVRAPDTENYYAFKLLEKVRRGKHVFSLERFTVVDGVRTQAGNAVNVPTHLAKIGDFNRISVRVVGDRVTTLVNGWGVDFWRDSTFKRGGVGLLADAGESALVRKMAVSGNEDTWGLILYGTVESLKSVQEAASSPFAIVLTPVPGQYLLAMSPQPGTLLLQGR
jgi:hypothetical protein